MRHLYVYTFTSVPTSYRHNYMLHIHIPQGGFGFEQLGSLPSPCLRLCFCVAYHQCKSR